VSQHCGRGDHHRKITAGGGNGAGERRTGQGVDLDPRMGQLLPGGVDAQCERPG
jgi:hypothetical protein